MKITLLLFREITWLSLKQRPYLLLLPMLLCCQNLAEAQVDLQITEIFSGQSGTTLTADWFEIKNAGDTAWVAGTDPDLYYDDESASAAEADLILGITDIQPGESVIVLITGNESEIATFSSIWSPVADLTGIEIGICDGAGLGTGGDAVNIWIGDPAASDPVASASYPYTGANDGQSYDVSLGSFSTVGNENGAVQTLALGGIDGNVPNVGSPGDQGPVAIDPNAPVITGDEAGAAPFLKVPADGPAFIGADIFDPTDPAATLGIPFDLADADSPLDNLILWVSSSDQSVVPDNNLVLTGTGADRLLKIYPASMGYAIITVGVYDTDGHADTYTIYYAASDATIEPGSTLFHYGISDGSTAIPVDATHMWVGNDEDQSIRLYDRNQSGLPVYSMDFNEALGSGNEIDIEGSFRSGSVIFWMGSHTNAERSMIFSTEESGAGTSATLAFTGYYDDLLEDLQAWDGNNGHSLGAGFLGLNDGLEIEGLAMDPGNPDGALLAFRGPLSEGRALVVPVNNFQNIVAAVPTPNSAVFGAPILFDLLGNSLRSLECNEQGCLLIAGPAGSETDFLLFTWSGDPLDDPELRAADLTNQTNMSSFEGIVSLPEGPFMGSDGDAAVVQLLADTGTFDYYDDGTEAKDLPNPEWKKFRTELVTLGAVIPTPVAEPEDVIINEIMQNPDVVDDADGEWFELYNTSGRFIDLNGWTISDAAGSDTHVIDNGGPLVIPAGGYLILGRNADPATNGGVTVDYQYSSITLGNADDELVLISTDLIEIDRVEWDEGLTFPDPAGASMSLQSPGWDNNTGLNWCESVSPYGDGDLGTPGVANDCAAPVMADLRITEIWPGQNGEDLTADWFEITNFGTVPWVSGIDQGLYYDDDSQDPLNAVPIEGITDIQPGESVIVMVGDETTIDFFTLIWVIDYDIDGIEVGWADGAGLSQGGDGITLFLGTPSAKNMIYFADYPALPSGVSYDLVLETFSQEGRGLIQTGNHLAVATTATAGFDGFEPAIGSPGNQGPYFIFGTNLQITEIFSGQTGAALTADWFEIKNNGTEAWISGVDPGLYYNDGPANPAEAVLIEGITEIPVGATAIVLITGDPADLVTFTEVWGEVIDLTGVAIGYADGATLDAGGGAVTIWVGDPGFSDLEDSVPYPDAAANDGRSYDVVLQAFSTVGNVTGAVQTLALGGDNLDMPNIGSPGDGLAIPAFSGLEITEIFSGQEGIDLTAGWFEIRNTGMAAWISGADPDLYYDDDSADPGEASLIEGISELQPGAAAIVLITGDTADITTFTEVWSAVIDLTGVQIGYTDGAGLGVGTDMVTLWLGDPAGTLPIDTASYPDTAPFDGQSYDVSLQSFSVVGNANRAVQTIALGGDSMDVPNIGSPGDGLAVPAFSGLEITEIFSGQEGADLTAGWFEIRNTGPAAWVSGVDPDLYYDNESADPGEASLIQGISEIQPEATAIVLISGDVADVNVFVDVWSPVADLTGIEIGYTDGAVLGGGGDAVTLWLGNPNTYVPVDTAAYPDTAPFDGQSYDSELGEFSTVGNANGAVETIALGGDNLDMSNIGSPGNQGPVSSVRERIATDLIQVYPNPGTGHFNLTTVNGSLMESAQVFNLNGKLVFSRTLSSKNTVELDLTHLPGSIYYIKVWSDEGLSVARIVKQ